MTDEVYAKDRDAWRAWLEEHHDATPAVWLVYYKKGSGKPSVTYDEAVEEALCFGWIDSKVQSLDDDRYRQYYTVRKPGSVWSKANKERVARMTEATKMTDAGTRAVKAAQADGSWEFLDEIDNLVLPDDLVSALSAIKGARETFDSFSESARKGILFWIKSAKRTTTRQKRIEQTASAAARGETPLSYL